MKPIIDAAAHAKFNGEPVSGDNATWDRVAETAETIVAAAIGTDSFKDTGLVTDTIYPKSKMRTVSVSNGLIREVVSITLNGEILDPTNYEVGYWTVSYKNGFFTGEVIIEYKAGYTSEDEMPNQLSQGILNTGASVYSEGSSSGRRVKSEKIGDYAVTFDESAEGFVTIPGDTYHSIRVFKKPSETMAV